MPSYPDDPDERDIILPRAGRARVPRPRRLWILLGLLFVGFLFVNNAVPLYTDWLWFGEVGYRGVFTTTILAKTLLFFSFGALFFVLLYFNARHARRLAPETADRFLMQNFGPQWGQNLQRGIGWTIFGLALFFSLWAGRVAADYWTSWLEFRFATPFHIADPVFGNDISFYVFRLPFLHFVWQFVFISLLLTTVAVLAIHIADRAIESWAGLPDVAPGVRAQALGLFAALALLRAIGYRLNAYDLLTQENGVFTGAGYADLHYRLFALNVQTLLLFVTGLLLLAAIRRGSSLRAPIIGAGAWLAAVVLLGGIVPSVMQKIYVVPNQLSAEQEYIARNIRYTRQGFGLGDVRRVEGFPADESLNVARLKANRDTLENVRLWDYEYLGRVYANRQALKNYYKFEKETVNGPRAFNIDIDRYPIGGRQRQVMLAARELDPDALPPTARTWQNQKLGYTHGYGVVMSPVNKIVQGAPDYFVQGLPPTASAEANALQVKQPGIYYGQLAWEYAFVDSAQQEFDYPSTDEKSATGGAAGAQDHYTHYAGKGGIRIGDAPLAKLAFSLRLGDPNVLLSSGFTPSTRVLFRRDIRDRLQTIAPFVQQDDDPYLVINPDDGRLVWVMDCYTMSDQYPYSTPVHMDLNPVMSVAPNYIRNSVKATVDAYDGTVTLYLADPNDPIAQTYAKIFPGLLKPMSAMPAGLHAHLRYPEDLFRIQRSVYATYHVDDPRVFYSKEDAWAIPVEPNADLSGAANPSNARQMEPYYVIMRLPEGTDGPNASLREEFLLMSPLAPINRENQNILGWMCARCDGDRYGQLVLYSFPQQASVNGPAQVVALINSDPSISKELSLLRTGGSSATLGNVLAIPIEKSLLYIAPLYVEASNAATKLPQLQRVIVAFGQRAAMAGTLEDALASLFPGYNETGTTPETAPQTSGTPETTPAVPRSGPIRVPAAVRTLIEKAATQYDAAQQKLKAGDFAGYGTTTKELERTLNELRHQAGDTSSPGR